MTQAQAVAEILFDLEAELRHLNLWQVQPPSAQALSSTLPFCVDTLELHQWLQFVLLPKLQTMLAKQTLLPTGSGISAMAEEVYNAKSPQFHDLLSVLTRLDKALSN